MAEKNCKVIQPPARIGIIGGGQLGKMITAEAKRMGYYVTILDPTPFSPAGQVADEQITACFTDKDAIKRLVGASDVTTYEFEHIDADILIALEAEGNNIYPSGKSLKSIQDKYIQKTLLKNAGLPIAVKYSYWSFWTYSNCLQVLWQDGENQRRRYKGWHHPAVWLSRNKQFCRKLEKMG